MENNENTMIMKCGSCFTDLLVSSWCVQCFDFICDNCVLVHQRMKITKNHEIKTMEEVSKTVIKCGSCLSGNIATSWCFGCSEFICGNCVQDHKILKITRDHVITTKVEAVYQHLPAASIVAAAIVTSTSTIAASMDAAESENLMVKNSTHNLTSSGASSAAPSTSAVAPSTSAQSTTAQSTTAPSAPSTSAPSTSAPSTSAETPATSAAIPSTSAGTPSTIWFNIRTVLNGTKDGGSIIKYYEKTNKILHKHQKKINKIVLDYALPIKKRLTYPQRLEIAQQISMLFPTEKASTYVRKERTKQNKIVAKGVLNAAYNYRITKLSGKRKRNVEAQDEIEEPSSPSQYLTEEIKASISYMQQNVFGDQNTLMEKWDETYQFRAAKMTHYNDFENIFRDWPLLTNLNGFTWINTDFEKMFGESTTNALQTGWIDFVETNINNIIEMLENPIARNSLEMLNPDQDFNEKCIIMMLALHHLTKPAPRGYKSKRWIPSTKSSKNSVFKRVYSKDSIIKASRKRAIERDLRSIEDHPMVYGIGESLEDISEFYVAVGSLLYSFDTFIDAFDASFKCYKVLKKPFPPESMKFWKLINLVFYKIESGGEF